MSDLAWWWRREIDPHPYTWADFLVDGQANPSVAKEKIDPNFVKALVSFYRETGIILKFSSVYRSPGHQIGIEGAAVNSAHLEGKAADAIGGYMNGQFLTAFQIFDIIARRAHRKSAGWGGIYMFNTAVYYLNKGFLHVDMRFHWKCMTFATRLGISINHTWHTFCAYELSNPKSRGALLYLQRRKSRPEDVIQIAKRPLKTETIPMWIWPVLGITIAGVITHSYLKDEPDKKKLDRERQERKRREEYFEKIIGR